MENNQYFQDITLITVTAVNIDSAAKALLISSEFCNFGSIKILSPIKPADLHSSIEHVAIPSINFSGYSRFMIEQLHKFVDTNFCLVIQPDGFVINPKMWTNEFLNYDYIGAPWPSMVNVSNASIDNIYLEKNRVGNGGFSLRSKNLLEVCSRIKFDALNFPIKSEDLIICHFLYEEMLKAGIKFAPFNLAGKFSIESLIENQPDNLISSFGFHGKHWLSNDHLEMLAIKSSYPKEFLSLLSRHQVTKFPRKPNRIGRLDPCPCGSANRFKDCHGRLN